MEQKCRNCGLTEKERDNLIDNKNILRVCEDCLKNEGLNSKLEEFLQIT